MKNIKIFMMLALCAAGLASCSDDAKPLASAVSADCATVTFDSEAPESVTVNVTSDGDWLAVVPGEWLKVEPSFGTGNAAVTVTADKNIDEDGTEAGTRRGTLSFVGSGVQADVAIVQEGDPAKDLQRIYKKVTSIKSGNNYLIVCEAKGKVADPISSSRKYGYLYSEDVEISDDGITMPNPENGFTFTSVEGGFTIQDVTTGRYYYNTSAYNNFNVSETLPETNSVWAVTFEDDGICKILNTESGKYIQYGQGTYTSFGAYSDEQGSAVSVFEEQPKD